ncbi:MAG: GAF domain-containing protein [Anaerolineales bacterium]|jgi:GAF domain-containing protein/HAMP domain-containing protein|nr:GAF domain-containing protein [Anaerolineales bacterium]
MSTRAASTPHETTKGKFKGSLAGALARTLLIFTLVPLVLMAGAAYLRARMLLREQANTQLESLLLNQTEVVRKNVAAREDALQALITGEDAALLIETALHANPKSSQFTSIRASFLDLFPERSDGAAQSFEEYLLINPDGVIVIASNEAWQGVTLDPGQFDFDQRKTMLMHELPFFEEDEAILLTAVNYETARGGSILGIIVGITREEGVKDLLNPLNSLAPYANSYFAQSDGHLFVFEEENSALSHTSLTPTSEDLLRLRLEEARQNGEKTPIDLELEFSTGFGVVAQAMWLPYLDSGVVLAIDSKTVFERVDSLAPFTLVLVAIAVAATGLVLFYGTKRIIQPLQVLSDVTRKFAEGDTTQRAAETDANDEIAQLARSFNYLAGQIEDNYKSLESKVNERTLQIQTAAEVAQNVTAIPDLDLMLKKTVELLVQQFGFNQASVFLIDRSGRNIQFKSGFGSATRELAERNYSLPIGSQSIIGWVAENNKARVASDVTEDPLHLRNELLAETRSEACVPISLIDQVLGVLDVQSAQPGAFSPDSILMLKTLASQVAAAIQTASLIEASKVNFQELDRLYRSSRLIAEANGEAEVVQVGGLILKNSPHPAILFQVREGSIRALAVSEALLGETPQAWLGGGVSAEKSRLEAYLARGSMTASSASADLPSALKDILRSLGLLTGVFLPIKGRDSLKALILIGSKQQAPAAMSIQPYENLADLMSVSIQRANAIADTERHLKEVESLASINEISASLSDIQSFFNALLSKIQQIIGDFNLIVAIYDKTTNSIRIPYSYENKKVVSIPPFPIGEGLTSILIRTRQPLLLVKDAERKAAELGAKTIGKPARSWMGAPMMIQGEPIGALIIQDLEREEAFDETDLKFFTTVANQVAGVIKNVDLLEESKRKALQLETAAEIARDISGSLNVDELLSKAVQLIRERFDFHHASIFLLDQPGEFAIIREATGEAGAQMKRQGHKIGVGSKSIVGYVTGKGETLVVNDTAKDVTYYPNPLLPDTRAEAAIPLRISDRILGALDVQSTLPYAFHEDNLRSLQILADQLAVAVENSELFAETQEHLSQHRLLHHITSSAASGTTLEEALDSAVNGLQVTLGGDRVMILLLDKEKKQLEVKASIGYSEDISRMKFEVGAGVTGWAAAHRRALRLGDVREDPRYIQISANTRSEMAIPLIYRNELLGVINVESEQVDAYSENDAEMLGTLGGSLAAVIANARLVEQIRAQSERERLISEITDKIRRSTDIQSILHTTASEISRVTGARHTQINILPKSGAAGEEKP